MASQLYQDTQKQNANPMAQYNEFCSNPMQFLASRGVNVPQQFVNNPKGAVQNMLNNGQMSQQQFNMLMQKAQQMGFRF